jgi:hypothetical protein
MANYVANQRNGVIAQSQWKHKGQTFLDVLAKVYSKHLGIQPFPDPVYREKLNQLRELRNALIHHNGSVNGLPHSMRAASPNGYAAFGLDHYTDLHDEFVIPNAEYLSRNLDLVETYLSFLSEKAYASAHPTDMKDWVIRT